MQTSNLQLILDTQYFDTNICLLIITFRTDINSEQTYTCVKSKALLLTVTTILMFMFLHTTIEKEKVILYFVMGNWLKK